METLKYKNAVNPPLREQGGFASDSLRAKLEEHSSDANDHAVINLAFTDYGGDFFDKITIAYFREKHPQNIVWEKTGWNGENAFIFGAIAEEFNAETDNYLLGFEDMEEFFYQAESAEYDTAFESFINYELSSYTFDRETVLEWLDDNKRGNCNITTQGVDFCSSNWVDALLTAGIIRPEED